MNKAVNVERKVNFDLIVEIHFKLSDITPSLTLIQRFDQPASYLMCRERTGVMTGCNKTTPSGQRQAKIFEHAQNAQIQIHPAHAQNLARAFALQ